MKFLSRVWTQFFALEGSTDTSPTPGVGPNPDEAAALVTIAELEERVARQARLLARSRALLQNSAFLAGYHQPALARDLRTLVAEIDRNEKTTARPAPAGWSLPGANSQGAAA